MSLNSVRKILEEELETFWSSRTPIFWDNVDSRVKQGESFIRPTLSNYDSDILSSKCQRDYYLFSIQVLTAVDIGLSLCMQFSDDIKTHFFMFESGNLICKKSIAERLGSEQQWYQYNVSIEVQHDNYF